MGKTILVTGGGGYIGRHVVKNLLDLGHKVVTVSLITEGIDSRATVYNMDLFSGEKDLYNKLGKPDVCLHMAWRDGFVHNSDAHIDDLAGHYHFIKNMVEAGLGQLVVMGTMHEVGYWEGPIDENTPCRPSSLYGISKNALRGMCELLAHEKDFMLQWVRAYYILGDDARNHSIFSKITQWEKEGLKTFPFTSGKNEYDFIQVDELARQISAVATQTEVAGIINCCSGEPISLKDKVTQFIEEHGYSIRPEYGAYPDREYDSPGVWGDATKIKKILNNH